MLVVSNSFFKAETGTLSIDWIVLTAALFAFGMAMFVAVSDGGFQNLSRVLVQELGEHAPNDITLTLQPAGTEDPLR